jgi:hypothetical protein
VPRRRANVLLPLEESILEVGLQQQRDGVPEFHGFALARVLDEGRSSLTAHGTLYKVLDRLEERGLLASRWENDDEFDGGRPRRRLYHTIPASAQALEASRALYRRAGVLLPGIATS